MRPLQEDDLCVVPHSNPLNKKREGTEALPYDNTQAIPVGNDLCVVPHVTPINQSTLPPALTQIITNYCALLPPQDNPAETLTMLHAWLSTLQEKNRLPTTYALQLILQKLPQMAKQSHLSPPEYIQEVICRGWQSFYPVPQFGTPKPAQKEPRSRSYDIDELEAMI